MNLPSLSPLPDISGATTPDNQGSGSGLTVGKIILGAATATLPSQLPSRIPSIQSIVVIILGLLLIAAGIFAFKEVRQTVVTTGKAAAKVAMV